MFSNFYIETLEAVYKALHFADEEIAKNGKIEEEFLGSLVEKSTKEELNLKELAIICRAKNHINYLEEKLKSIHRSKRGKVRYIAPTFQTNSCMDVCRECGWNRDNNTTRVFLRPADFEAQLSMLKEAGFGIIEISNGTVPQLLEWKSFKDYLEIVKKKIDVNKGESFGICSATFDDSTFANIFPEYAQFWVQWMETYDLPSYFKVHRFTARIPEKFQRYSKANFIARLNSYDKVMSLGADVMLGVQYGLNPNEPAFDTLMTIAHARYLREEYGRAPLTFGTVINNNYGCEKAKYSDSLSYNFTLEEYRTFLVAYKLAMPEMGRWLNTRIPFDLIEKAIVDNDFYTGECSDMVPGLREGLTKLTNQQAGQFRVFELEKNVWEDKLRKLGLRVDYVWMNPKRLMEVNKEIELTV